MISRPLELWKLDFNGDADKWVNMLVTNCVGDWSEEQGVNPNER